jgi:tRNA nucleotidyltransferase/poly(A) polymerase
MNTLINGREADIEGISCSENVCRFLDQLPRDLILILNKIASSGGGVWIVGGAVRDSELGHHPVDIDLAVDLTPDEMMNVFTDAILTGEDFGTISIRGESCLYQATTLRTESNYIDGRRPEKVEWGKSLKQDLERRDFTINAMAIDASRRIIYDPHNGRTDLSRGLVRAVGNAHKRLSEDGLRIMRAYRFIDRNESGVWNFENSLAQSLILQKHMLDPVARERIWIEWKKILNGTNSGEVINKMANDGILDRFLIGEWDIKYAVIEALKQNLSEFDEIEKFALLLSENTRKEVIEICSKLKTSRIERDRIISIHDRFGKIPHNSKQSLRLYRAVLKGFSEKHLLLEMILKDANISLAKKQLSEFSKSDIKDLLNSLAKLDAQKTQVEPLANGTWIMQQTGMPKGIRLGRLKSWLHTIQIERDLINLSDIELVLSTLSWENCDFSLWPELKFP